jgi:ketopantoate reductase
MPEARTFEQCMEAVAAVARTLRIQLDDTVVTDTMRHIDSVAANATTHCSEILRWERQARSTNWNGTVVRQEPMAKVSTPVNQFIYHSLFPQELKARGKVCFLYEPLRNFHSWC